MPCIALLSYPSFFCGKKRDMERNQFLVGTFVRRTPLQMVILAETMITVSSHPQWLKNNQTLKKQSEQNKDYTFFQHSTTFLFLAGQKKTSEHPHYPSIRILMRLLLEEGSSELIDVALTLGGNDTQTIKHLYTLRPPRSFSTLQDFCSLSHWCTNSGCTKKTASGPLK